MKIVIVDYGMGNLRSIESIFKYHQIYNIMISNKYETLKEADKLILPGVGSFKEAMRNIENLNLKNILDEVVLQDKKPILGICLGMQLLSLSSDEDGGAEGLGYINANCKKFNDENLKVPHVGFNQVSIPLNSKLFKDIKSGSDFYFTHSYRLESQSDFLKSTCSYGEEFIAAYEVDNILGTQFHPELSQTNGLQLIKNFIENF